MIWNICYTVAVLAVCVSVFLFIKEYHWNRKKYSTAATTLIIGFAVSLFALLLPIQLDAFASDGASVVKAVLVALNRTLRGFALTDINFMPKTRMTSGRRDESPRDGASERKRTARQKRRLVLCLTANCPKARRSMTATRRSRP